MAIPIDFMLSASGSSLSDFQLARLNEAANLKSEAREIMEEAERKYRKRMDDAFDRAVEAAVACWFRMYREELLRACSSITAPNEAEVRLWLREHGSELLKMCVGELPEKTGSV
jgi:thiamine biosynthesis lipoprotein ApbE